MRTSISFSLVLLLVGSVAHAGGSDRGPRYSPDRARADRQKFNIPDRVTERMRLKYHALDAVNDHSETRSRGPASNQKNLTTAPKGAFAHIVLPANAPEKSASPAPQKILALPVTAKTVAPAQLALPAPKPLLALPAPEPLLALPAPKPMLALPAPKPMLALPAPAEAEHITLAPAPKPSLMARAGSMFSKMHPITWVKNNFTVSTKASDHMVAAKALRKEGRIGEAADEITSAPAPRGFVERMLLGRAESKVRSASMTAMKDAAADGRVHDAQAAHAALEKMAPTMGKFAAWRANRAVAKSAKLSISAARTAGKHGDLDAAHDSVLLASHFGASDRQLDKASARLEKDATKQANLAAEHGDIEATNTALEHALNVPGSQMTEDEHQTILEKSVSMQMQKLVKEATTAYKQGDPESAAYAMAELKDLRNMSGVELSGRVHRDEVRMTALLGSHIDHALAEMTAPEPEVRAEAPKKKTRAKAPKKTARAEASNDNEVATN